MKRKIALLLASVACVALFLSGAKPKVISEDEAKKAGLALINHVFDVNETDAVVFYQEQTGATLIDGDYEVTGKEQPVYIYIVSAAKQEDGEYLYYAHVDAETGVAFAAFRSTVYELELTPEEQKDLQDAQEKGIDTESVYLRITTECQMAARKWIPEKFELKAGILGFVNGGGSLDRAGGSANFYVVIRDGTIYHVTLSWPQLTIMDVTILNQTRPTEDMR